MSNEVGNRSRTRVEVVDEFVARELSKVACYLLEFVGLLSVGLIETFRAYFKS